MRNEITFVPRPKSPEPTLGSLQSGTVITYSTSESPNNFYMVTGLSENNSRTIVHLNTGNCYNKLLSDCGFIVMHGNVLISTN